VSGTMAFAEGYSSSAVLHVLPERVHYGLCLEARHACSKNKPHASEWFSQSSALECAQAVATCSAVHASCKDRSLRRCLAAAGCYVVVATPLLLGTMQLKCKQWRSAQLFVSLTSLRVKGQSC
jgi:hypothetical protein